MKRLLLDIEALVRAKERLGEIQCAYLYHRSNRGELSLLEVAEFAVYCRQCPDSHCVKACPREALERQEDHVVKRYNLRCIGCRSCVLACPFGTIFPEVMNYITAKCDYCLPRWRKNPDYIPLCARTAPANAIQVVERERENPEEDEFWVGEYLVVKAPNWRAKEKKA